MTSCPTSRFWTLPNGHSENFLRLRRIRRNTLRAPALVLHLGGSRSAVDIGRQGVIGSECCGSVSTGVVRVPKVVNGRNCSVPTRIQIQPERRAGVEVAALRMCEAVGYDRELLRAIFALADLLPGRDLAR